MPDLVSIIMPTYNSEKTLRESISTITSQTYDFWELIITDDFSQDNTWNILIELSEADARIKIFKLNENSGAAVARNNSINFAQGRFIAFLDSDDKWLPQKLEKQIDFMISGDHCFTYTSYEKINEKSEIIGFVKPRRSISAKECLMSCDIGCLTAMYDKSKIGKYYMPLIRKRQDLGLWVSILKEHGRAYCLQECLSQYRVQTGTLSANKFSAAQYQWRFYREVEKMKLSKAIFYFIIYAIKGFIKYNK